MHRANLWLVTSARIFWHKYNADIYINTIFEHIFSMKKSKKELGGDFLPFIRSFARPAVADAGTRKVET
jgi:hypothetical protein